MRCVYVLRVLVKLVGFADGFKEWHCTFGVEENLGGVLIPGGVSILALLCCVQYKQSGSEVLC